MTGRKVPAHKLQPAPSEVQTVPSRFALSIILPTYNESANIRQLIADLLRGLSGARIEIIVVDDASPDGTGEIIKQMALSDHRMRLISRPKKMGLSSAVFTGVTESRGAAICVMDSDFSHDPTLVPQMVDKLNDGYDVVIGSRYTKGGNIENWPAFRRITSSSLNFVARTLFRLEPKDVLSGFVVARREVLENLSTHYSARGFKFLVEVLVNQSGLRVYEWPITFLDRRGGKSKAGMREAVEFGKLCLKLLSWKASKPFRRQTKHA